jgi:hypothetical protein
MVRLLVLLILGVIVSPLCAHRVFSISQGSGYSCIDCSENYQCNYYSSFSVAAYEARHLRTSSSASCSPGDYYCYRTGTELNIVDLTSVAKGGRNISISCSPSQSDYQYGYCKGDPSYVTLSFLQPVKGTDGTFWPFPFTGECSNYTGAEQNCTSGDVIPISTPPCVPTSSNGTCVALVTQFPKAEALLLSVSASFTYIPGTCAHEGNYDCEVDCNVTVV